MKRTVIQEIVSLSTAIENCQQSGNTEWETRHEEILTQLCSNYLPSGSGIDAGVELVCATPQKIVLSFSFHHMDENGMYDGWTEHKCIVTADLLGIHINITGSDKHGIKDYLHDVFAHALTQEIDN